MISADGTFLPLAGVCLWNNQRMTLAHVAGGGTLSDLIYIAIPLVLVGLMLMSENRRMALILFCVGAAIGLVGVFDIVRS